MEGGIVRRYALSRRALDGRRRLCTLHTTVAGAKGMDHAWDARMHALARRRGNVD